MKDTIEETIVNQLKNDENEELINLMREKMVSDGVIMLTLFGIGSHTEYYKVLYDRINNYEGEINDNTIKGIVTEIFHEIDKKDLEK